MIVGGGGGGGGGADDAVGEAEEAVGPILMVLDRALANRETWTPVKTMASPAPLSRVVAFWKCTPMGMGFSAIRTITIRGSEPIRLCPAR